MAGFIGRKEELAALQGKYDQDGFHLAVMYGKQRIGKTTMINKFIEN